MGLPILGLPQTTRIYLALEPVDMRKHYDGLWALAAQHLGLDPKTGTLFVFTNKSRDRIKLLHWDGTGVWVLAKRLEQGRFTWPTSATGDPRKLTLEPAASRFCSTASTSRTVRKKLGMSARKSGTFLVSVCMIRRHAAARRPARRLPRA
jgi:transposase